MSKSNYSESELAKLATMFGEACQYVQPTGDSTFIKLWIANGQFHFAVLHNDVSKKIDKFIKESGN